MFSLNKASLIGNLGQDPEIRMTQGDAKVCTLSVATTEGWKDKSSGEWKDKTEWHRVVIWNSILVERAEKFLKKGSKVYIEGQLQTRKWTDKSGAEKYTTEIVLGQFRGELVLLDGKSESGKQTQHNEAKANGYQKQKGQQAAVDLDDEIPF